MCAPLSRGDANKLKLTSLFFKCALLSNRDVHELKFIRHFFLMCSSIHGDANKCGLFLKKLLLYPKGTPMNFSSLAIFFNVFLCLRGHQQVEACWLFFFSMLLYLRVMRTSFSSSSIFFWSLMVYPTLVSSTMVSFELSPLSNELVDEFLLVGIFFLRITSHQPFCVCLLLLARRHVLLFLVFLCCYL